MFVLELVLDFEAAFDVFVVVVWEGVEEGLEKDKEEEDMYSHQFPSHYTLLI